MHHATTATNIEQEMFKCKSLAEEKRWKELVGTVQLIVAKARRVVEVGWSEVLNSKGTTRYKSRLTTANTKLDKG